MFDFLLKKHSFKGQLKDDMLEKYSFRSSLLLILLASFIIISCSSEDVDVTKLQPTELEVTVLNANGQPVPNAEVRLYRSQRAFELLSQEVVRGMTNGSGKVLFSDLQPVNYYFYASYKDQNAGLIRSNYGNYDPEIDETFTNNELGDFLTENGLTKVTVSTLFTKPINPQTVSFDSIFITYTGEEIDFPFEAKDTLNLFFGLYEAFNPGTPAEQQEDLLFALTYEIYPFYQNSPDNIKGQTYSYEFDEQVVFNFAQLVPENSGSFSIPLDLIPLEYDLDTDSYDYFQDLESMKPGLSPGVNDGDGEFYYSLDRARETGDYPNRVIVMSDAFLGKNNYVMDLKITWN